MRGGESPKYAKQQVSPIEVGESGNPIDRPDGSHSIGSPVIESLLDRASEAITRKLIDKAVDGDTTALRLCVERLLPPRGDRTISFDLPPIESAADALRASSSVLAACAKGALSPNDAAAIMGLIATHVRTIEVAEIEARVSALEREQKK
jgi:hypothetical protein